MKRAITKLAGLAAGALLAAGAAQAAEPSPAPSTSPALKWWAGYLSDAQAVKLPDGRTMNLFCLGSGHGIGNAQAQFLPHAIEWTWKGYAPKKDK